MTTHIRRSAAYPPRTLSTAFDCYAAYFDHACHLDRSVAQAASRRSFVKHVEKSMFYDNMSLGTCTLFELRYHRLYRPGVRYVSRVFLCSALYADTRE